MLTHVSSLPKTPNVLKHCAVKQDQSCMNATRRRAESDVIKIWYKLRHALMWKVRDVDREHTWLAAAP